MSEETKKATGYNWDEPTEDGDVQNREQTHTALPGFIIIGQKKKKRKTATTTATLVHERKKTAAEEKENEEEKHAIR